MILNYAKKSPLQAPHLSFWLNILLMLFFFFFSLSLYLFIYNTWTHIFFFKLIFSFSCTFFSILLPFFSSFLELHAIPKLFFSFVKTFPFPSILFFLIYMKHPKPKTKQFLLLFYTFFFLSFYFFSTLSFTLGYTFFSFVLSFISLSNLNPHIHTLFPTLTAFISTNTRNGAKQKWCIVKELLKYCGTDHTR